jgi:putative copper export protein/methionine-rich copper-binding protein CopC
VGLIVILLSVAAPGPSYAHLALREASPAADERLTVVPDALRLTFTEAIELGLSTIELRGPGDAVVALNPSRSADDRTALESSIEGVLVAGEYRVIWQAVGRDGHPVRGEYAFTIEPGATGLEDEGRDMVPPDPGQTTPPRDALEPLTVTLTTRSPLYAAVRWLMYVGMVGLLGSIGFMALLRSLRVRRLSTSFLDKAARGATVYGTLSLLPLALSLPLRIQAQSHVVFGSGVTRERFLALLGTTWGLAWTVQLLACGGALAGLLMARSGLRAGWLVAAAAGLALVATPAISGHAAAVERFPGIAIVADSMHVLGAGLWIGTLAAVLLVGVPTARMEAEGTRGSVLAAMVLAFSPIAMTAALVVVATGLVATSFQLTGPTDLWATGYGRLLSAKLFMVAMIVGLGAFNWRRMRPVMGDAGADFRLRRSGGAEVTAALIAIMLTAVLVAVQPPARAAGTPAQTMGTGVD